MSPGGRGGVALWVSEMQTTRIGGRSFSSVPKGIGVVDGCCGVERVGSGSRALQTGRTRARLSNDGDSAGCRGEGEGGYSSRLGYKVEASTTPSID